MRISRLAVIGALAAAFAIQVAAQTTQTNPGKPSPAITSPTPSTGSKPTTPAAVVDINSASSADLDKLPGIGKSRAEAIIKNRPYKGKDDLLSRHIIPSNVYNGIKDKIIAKQG
jgi:competence protein ComEA